MTASHQANGSHPGELTLRSCAPTNFTNFGGHSLATTNGNGCNYGTPDVWQDAPILIGSTKFEPLPDVKNIMITGGAGFM
jgi:hypothetical protein